MRLALTVLLVSAAASAMAAQSTNRGVQLFETHDRAGARAEFASAVKRNDRDARAHHYIGRLALIDNDVDAAVEHLERAVELDAKVSNYHYWYGAAVAQQAPRASKFRMPILGRRAMGALERAVVLDGRNIEALDMLVDFYSMAPAFMGGGMDKAKERAVILSRLDAVRGHVALGRLAIRTRDTSAVDRELNAAIALAPDSLRAYSVLASWHIRDKQWPQVFATFDRYHTQRPDDPHGLYHIGRAAALSGQQLARGEQALRTFIADPPRDAASPLLARAYLRLGEVLKHQGKSAESRIAIQHAVKLDPWNEDAKKSLK